MDDKEYKVCLIDDDPVAFELIQKTLKNSNIKIHYESTVEAGLKYVFSNKIDLLLLDIIMPNSNGLDTLKKIRQTFNQIQLPIIMITALDQNTDIVDGLVAGANDYCTKPVHPEIMRARIFTQLQLSSIRSENLNKKEIETINQMITTLNHEINNPLTIAMANLKNYDQISEKNIITAKDSLIRIKVILKKIHKLSEGNISTNTYAANTKIYKV